MSKSKQPNERELALLDDGISAVCQAARSIGVLMDRDTMFSTTRSPNVVLCRYMLVYVLRECFSVRSNVASSMCKLSHATSLYGSREILKRASVEPQVAALFRETMTQLGLPTPQFIMLASEKKVGHTFYSASQPQAEHWRKR